MLFVYRLWAVLDACVLAAKGATRPFQIGASPSKWVVGVGVGVLLTGIIGVHAAVAEVDMSWQHALDCQYRSDTVLVRHLLPAVRPPIPRPTPSSGSWA